MLVSGACRRSDVGALGVAPATRSTLAAAADAPAASAGGALELRSPPLASPECPASGLDEGSDRSDSCECDATCAASLSARGGSAMCAPSPDSCMRASAAADDGGAVAVTYAASSPPSDSDSGMLGSSAKAAVCAGGSDGEVKAARGSAALVLPFACSSDIGRAGR